MRLGIISALVLTGMVVLGAAACGGSSAQPSAGERPLVVVSLPLFADFVRQVAGERVEVLALLPSGADPHTFEPTPRDVQRLREADVVFINGRGLEASIEAAIENNIGEDTFMVALSSSPDPDPLAEDPHAWLDARRAQAYVANIRDALIQADPAHGASYRENAQRYLEELGQLDQEIAQRLSQIPAASRKLVTYHNSFAHFARRYRLELVGAVVASPGGDLSPADIAHLLASIRDQGIPAVFVEPQFNSQVLTRLADDAGVQVCTLYSDALDERVQSYIDMMRFNAAELVRCLGGAAVGY